MRLIDADKMATDELAAFISAQLKITDAANAVFGSRANIVRSCNSKTRTAYGYRWMWETDFCSYGERKDGDRNG